jgi:hypothetical protein
MTVLDQTFPEQPEDSGEQEAFAAALPRPNFPAIEKAKLAIAQTQQQYREDQRRCRLAQGSMDAEAGSLLHSGPTVSTATVDTYLHRGRLYFRRYQRETTPDLRMEDLDPIDFVTWLDGVKEFWTPSTWRSNRQSATAFVGAIPHENRQEALAVLHAMRKHASRNETAIHVTEASLIKHQHFQKILKALPLQSRSQTGCWLTDWMIAGVHTGLRPDEWSLTDIEEQPNHPQGEKFWLHVFNVHVTETRLANSFRTIDLSNLSIETRRAVSRLSNVAREWTLAGKFAHRKSAVSGLLRTTGRQLFPRMQLHYTLDSVHRQFIANMKTIYGREEISALIGELFINQRLNDHANHRPSWETERITEIPVPPDRLVLRFRRSLAIYEQRRALHMLRKQYDQRKR